MTTEPAAGELPRKQHDIVETASALFRRFGMRRITVEEICREAGVSKATFYKYFDNKDDLVRHILGALSDDALQRLAEVEALSVPFEQKVRLLIDDRLERTRQASDVFITELLEAGGELTDLVHQIQARTQERLLDFIGTAQRSGEVRREIARPFLLAILRTLPVLAADEQLRAHYSDYTALTSEIVDFFFYGLLGGPAEGAD